MTAAQFGGTIKFAVGQRLQLDGIMHRVRRRIDVERLNIEAIETGEATTRSFEWLDHAWLDGRLRILPLGWEHLEPRVQRLITAELDTATEAMRRQAYWMQPYVEALLNHRNGTLQPYVDIKIRWRQIAEDRNRTRAQADHERPPSRSSIYMFAQRYASADLDIRALLPDFQARGNRKARIDTRLNEILDELIEAIYLTPEARTKAALVAACMRHVEALNSAIGQPDAELIEPLPLPTRRMIVRRADQVEKFDLAYSRCQCGQSLPLLNVGKVQESQLAFDKWLDAKLMQHSPAAPLQTELVPCPILDELPLQDAISIVERLGAFSINPVETFAETWSSYGPAAVMLRGYEVASAGERGIEEVLDKLFDARKERDARVRDAGGKPRRWGVQAAYGGAFALWFSGRVDAGSYASLVPVVVRHAKSRVLLKSGFEIFGISDSETSLTLTRAAKHCGISRRRLNEFLRSIGVVPPGKHQGMPLRIPVEVADEYRKRFANSVNMTEAEKLFGISDGAIIELVKAKVLPALIEGGGKLQDYAIETKEITGLLNRLEVRSLNEPSPSHVALPKAFSGKSGILELVGFVLNGQLSVRSVDQDAVGLNRLMVDRADVLQLNRDAAADEMTLQRAAERLNIKWEAVRQLVTLGHLKLAGRYIDREQLISFETHFIKGSDVATMLSMHWKWASRKLAQMGIEPAIDRSQCRSVFYERSKIEALVQRSGEADTPEAERFTPREAGDRLGISSAAVLRLIQSGRIAGTEILSNWLIDADALTDFEARHLKLSEAAKLLEIGTRLIEGRLESQGIHLSIDRSECGVAFYDKQTILALAA